MSEIEPFGYFRAEPFGWADCSYSDEGATPLYDQDAIDLLQARIRDLEAHGRAPTPSNADKEQHAIPAGITTGAPT